MKCEKCGNLIEDKYIWCPVCGAKKPKGKMIVIADNNCQKDEITFCEKCGKEVKLGSKFCDNCGNKLIDENNSNNNESFAVYCECGQKLEPGWKFCTQCQKPITFEIRSEKQNVNDKQNDANIYLIIYAISAGVYLFGSRIPYVANFSLLGLLVALVTIITGKIKCPKNVLIKVLFWITIVYFIFLVALILWIIAVCSDVIQSCPG